jgi:hypothetical protein
MLSTSSFSETEVLITSLRKELGEKYAPTMQLIAEQIKIKEETITKLKNDIQDMETRYQEDKRKTVALYEEEIRRLTQEIVCLKLELDKSNFIKAKTISPRSSNLVVMSEDPRIHNRSLPFDAQPTRKFGGLAYTSSVYLGYVWHYGNWYEMTNDLTFPALSRDIFINKVKNKPNVHYNGKIVLDDTFVPIINHGVRYFLRAEFEHKSLVRLYLYDLNTNKTEIINTYNNVWPDTFHPEKLTFEDEIYTLKNLN